jgi:glycosyltransferase involved in cell wall biosynthesis
MSVALGSPLSARPTVDGQCVTILIPVHNEAATVEAVLEGVRRLPLNTEIIVIDDGSSDATPDVLRAWRARHEDTIVLTRPRRGGKGAALRTALPHASGGVVVIQDADLEYDPAEIPRLLGPILRGEADVVFGSRLAAGAAVRTWGRPNRLGNRALSALTSLLFWHSVSDMETGYKLFGRETLLALPLRADCFAFEPEVTALVLKRGLRLTELPISYHARTRADGKKIRWRDAWRAVCVLVAERAR